MARSHEPQSARLDRQEASRDFFDARSAAWEKLQLTRRRVAFDLVVNGRLVALQPVSDEARCVAFAS